MDLVFSVHERRCADVDDPGLDENKIYWILTKLAMRPRGYDTIFATAPL